MEDRIRVRDVAGIVDCMQAVFKSSSPHSKDDVTILRELSEFLKKCSSTTAALVESAAKANRLAIASASNFSVTASVGEVSNQTNSGDVISVDNMQLIEPRGRFGAIFSDRCASFENKSTGVRIEWGNIAHAICIPNNASAKKDSEDVIVLIFNSPIPLNTSVKTVKSVAFVISRLVASTGSLVVTSEDGKPNGNLSHVFHVLVF